MPVDLLPQGRVERRRSRTRRRRWTGALVAVAVLAAGALVAAAVLWSRGRPAYDAALVAGATATTVVPPPTGPDGAPLPPPRSLSAEEPLRLYIGGDSLAGSLAYELAPLVARTGVVAPTYDSHAGSGLAADDLLDWEQRAREEPARIGAEAVVYVMGANDFWTVADPSDRTAPWRATYAGQVASMVELLTAGGQRPLIWVGAPVMGDPEMSSQVAAINAVVVAELARHPDVVYVDAYELFSGPDGGYASELPDELGQVVTVRDGDGVHFTSAGAARLARAVFQHLDARWRISALAVPDVVQPVAVSPGGEGDAPG